MTKWVAAQTPDEFVTKWKKVQLPERAATSRAQGTAVLTFD
jgi:hypothetical protein